MEEPERDLRKLLRRAGERTAQMGALLIAVDMLSDRKRAILRMRYGLGAWPKLNTREVAWHFGLSVERIYEITSEAIRELEHPRMKRVWSTPFIAADSPVSQPPPQ